MANKGSIAQSRLHIEYLSPHELKGNPLNPRVHPPRQIKALCRSIEEHGFSVPVIVDREGRLIAGHGRVEAGCKTGLAEIPVVRLDHLSEAQVRSLMIADNKLTDMSRWDDDLLAENFRLLTVEGIELDLEATGFSMGEIDLILDPATAHRLRIRTMLPCRQCPARRSIEKAMCGFSGTTVVTVSSAATRSTRMSGGCSWRARKPP